MEEIRKKHEGMERAKQKGISQKHVDGGEERKAEGMN
jgi:hypothetical protein